MVTFKNFFNNTWNDRTPGGSFTAGRAFYDYIDIYQWRAEGIDILEEYITNHFGITCNADQINPRAMIELADIAVLDDIARELDPEDDE